MEWLDNLLVKCGLIIDVHAPLPSSSDAWYGYMLSSGSLTQGEQSLLDLFTEDEWCTLIPWEVKVNTCKLTVKQSVGMFENYVLHGVWK